MFWGVAEGRDPTAATLLRNIILVSIPPPSFGRPLWRVRTWVAPPRHSQVALFTEVRGRMILRSSTIPRPYNGCPFASAAGLFVPAATTARGCATRPHEMQPHPRQGPVEG